MRPSSVMSVEPSDEELLVAWRRGHVGAGQQLVRRYFGQIRRFFINKTETTVAADLVQETFAACATAKDRFEGRSSFRTFLFAIAHNVLRGHYRLSERRREREGGELTESVFELGLSPESAMRAKGEQRVLLEGLRRISLSLQIVLELHYWERLTAPQISEILGIPQGTVYGRLSRGREALGAAIAKLGHSAELLRSTTADLEKWAAEIATRLRSDVSG